MRLFASGFILLVFTAAVLPLVAAHVVCTVVAWVVMLSVPIVEITIDCAVSGYAIPCMPASYMLWRQMETQLNSDFTREIRPQRVGYVKELTQPSLAIAMRLRLYVQVWNELVWRTTTNSEDMHCILSNLLDIQTSELVKIDSHADRMLAILCCYEKHPLRWLFQDVPAPLSIATHPWLAVYPSQPLPRIELEAEEPLVDWVRGDVMIDLSVVAGFVRALYDPRSSRRRPDFPRQSMCSSVDTPHEGDDDVELGLCYLVWYREPAWYQRTSKAYNGVCLRTIDVHAHKLVCAYERTMQIDYASMDTMQDRLESLDSLGLTTVVIKAPGKCRTATNYNPLSYGPGY